MGINNESMNVNDIQGASVESSGDLTMTSPDSLESSGSIPGQTMNGSSLGEQGIKGQTMNGNSLGEQEVKVNLLKGAKSCKDKGLRKRLGSGGSEAVRTCRVFASR